MALLEFWNGNSEKFLLQANPAASQFRFKALELADKLETIFDGSTVTAETEPTSRRRKYNNASTMPHLSNREPEIPKPDEKTERFCDAVESRGALMIQKEAQFVPSRGGKLSYSIGECIDCLDGMEEVEPGSDLYLFALDIFLKKEYREVFLQLKKPSEGLHGCSACKHLVHPFDRMLVMFCFHLFFHTSNRLFLDMQMSLQPHLLESPS